VFAEQPERAGQSGGRSNCIMCQTRPGHEELLPGESLPTVTAMHESYGVSKTTVLKALAILRDEGLIYTVPRWGSFVQS
jgi:DNA-binding transcriptional regulator YhcF (GntR family)